MGYISVKIGGKVNHSQIHEIIAHRRMDILDLPTNPNTICWGSECRVMSDDSRWILDQDYIWKEVCSYRTVHGGEGWSTFQRNGQADQDSVYKYISWTGSLQQNDDLIDKVRIAIFQKTGTSLSLEDLQFKSINVFTKTIGDEFEINGKSFKTASAYPDGGAIQFYTAINEASGIKNVETFSALNNISDVTIDIIYL